MNLLNNILFAAVLLVISNTAAALNLSTDQSLKSDATVLTSIIKTDHEYGAMVRFDYLAGDSTSAPCSDLQVMSTQFTTIILEQSTENITSEQLAKNIGPNRTCVRIETRIGPHSVMFSSGDVKLSWDWWRSEYNEATPNTVTIDVSAGDIKS